VLGQPALDSEALGDVVGRSDRQNRERHAAPRERPRGFADGAVAAGDHDEVDRLLAYALKVGALLDLAHDFVAGPSDLTHDLLEPRALARRRVVKQGNPHGLRECKARASGGSQVALESSVRILVANDDGVYSPGISALAEVASEFGTVRVVAP